MPLILPSNSITGGGYTVDNSLRFDDGSSDYLNATNGTPTNADRCTISCWVKRGNLVEGVILGNYSSVNFRAKFGFDSNSKLEYYQVNDGGVTCAVTTDMLFRDVSAWYHIVCAVDTTDGTASNRVKIYVNGTQVAVTFSTEIAQNLDFKLNQTSVPLDVGQDGNNTKYFDGYMAEVVMIDGTQNAVTDFGEFDEDSGIWKPIDVSGLTFGTNGFYLPFENSGALGQDDSGNGNNFTVNNLTSIDQTTDTPTNNFATLNPLAQTTTKGAVSEGNLEFDNAGASDGWEAIASTIAVTSGKWYFEYKVIDGGDSAGNGSQVGFLNYDVSNFQNDANSDLAGTGEYGWYGAGNTFINGSDAGVISNYTDADIVMVAMDLDNLKAYWGKNGTWVNSGDPTSGATGTGGHTIVSASSNAFAFAVAHREGGNGQANFGSPPFTISSGNADGNDYGNFEYAPPSGYYALCTKNLAEFG